MALPLSAVSAMAKGKFGAIGTFGHFERIGGFSKYISSASVFTAFVLFISSNVVLPALLIASATYAVAGYLMLVFTSSSGMAKHSPDEKPRRVENRSKNINRTRLMAWQTLLTIGASITLLCVLISPWDYYRSRVGGSLLSSYEGISVLTK